mmetsp:Transcript_18511/g.51524  ORF Transcript_18511/g.51524 Transcript_18511/m.51524 type:complete len:212 (+) Transcript_18511:1634-2269(+)
MVTKLVCHWLELNSGVYHKPSSWLMLQHQPALLMWLFKIIITCSWLSAATTASRHSKKVLLYNWGLAVSRSWGTIGLCTTASVLYDSRTQLNPRLAMRAATLRTGCAWRPPMTQLCCWPPCQLTQLHFTRPPSRSTMYLPFVRSGSRSLLTTRPVASSTATSASSAGTGTKSSVGNIEAFKPASAAEGSKPRSTAATAAETTLGITGPAIR